MFPQFIQNANIIESTKVTTSLNLLWLCTDTGRTLLRLGERM